MRRGLLLYLGVALAIALAVWCVPKQAAPADQPERELRNRISTTSRTVVR